MRELQGINNLEAVCMQILSQTWKKGFVLWLHAPSTAVVISYIKVHLYGTWLLFINISVTLKSCNILMYQCIIYSKSVATSNISMMLQHGRTANDPRGTSSG